MSKSQERNSAISRCAAKQGQVVNTWRSTLRISERHSSSTYFCRFFIFLYYLYMLSSHLGYLFGLRNIHDLYIIFAWL
ncbi:hypothetical protein Syun_023837 [Stephania yunnanensis]|uniref:Uncharacterized protein n=1 Tax=Stephania yunnanensis TaxID=152371 RepID=A0AAP0F9R3_9MAGN